MKSHVESNLCKYSCTLMTLFRDYATFNGRYRRDLVRYFFLSMFVLVSNIVSVCDMSSDIEFGTKE